MCPCPRSVGGSARSSRPRPCSWWWTGNRPVAEVARELAINATTLGNWVKAWRRDHPEAEPEQGPVERARVAEMEDELRRLRMENEFLKKAAAFFAREQG